MAHKKAGSSSKNGRDSVGQRLGVKVGDGQRVHAGSILVRQRGMTFGAGQGTGLGRDYTVFATVGGRVRFEHITRAKKRVRIESLTETFGQPIIPSQDLIVEQEVSVAHDSPEAGARQAGMDRKRAADGEAPNGRGAEQARGAGSPKRGGAPGPSSEEWTTSAEPSPAGMSSTGSASQAKARSRPIKRPSTPA